MLFSECIYLVVDVRFLEMVVDGIATRASWGLQYVDVKLRDDEKLCARDHVGQDIWMSEYAGYGRRALDDLTRAVGPLDMWFSPSVVILNVMTHITNYC